MKTFHNHFKGTNKKTLTVLTLVICCLVMQMGGEGMQNGFLSCLAISFRANHNGLKSENLFKDQFCNLTKLFSFTIDNCDSISFS